MKSMHDPMRWAEPGSDAPGGLATAIRDLRAGRGSTEQVEELGRRLAPQFAGPLPAGGGTAVSPWIKAAGALLLSGAVGLYAFTRLVHSEPPPATRPVVRSVVAGKTVAPSAIVTVPPSVPPALEPLQLPKARIASKSRRSHSAGSVAPTPMPAPEAELVLLQRSQTALDRDASAALSLAEEHARDYPNGVFTQEREILAIEALLKLRRRPDALARAEVFLQRYPESPHSRRVRALLDRSRALGPATIQGGTDHSMGVPVPEGDRHDPN